MPAAPLELTLDLEPRARFDAIDVRERAARSHGDVLDAYPRAVYCSFHTTAGYLDQALAARLKRQGLLGYIEAFRALFPEGAGYRHDELDARSELSHEQDPEPITAGMFGYSLIRAGQNQPFFKALMEELPDFGIPVEGLHTETGPGVYEAAIQYCEGIEAADRGVLFKAAVKEIGQRFGIMPSFMAKWSTQYPGCSGHIHQSLSDGKSNLFYDARSPRRMSKLFESYVAGQLACLEDIQVFFAPTVNSYKRLVDGMWAPIKATWGVDNRTASLRVIPGSAKSTRLETRCPGADINAYLAKSL